MADTDPPEGPRTLLVSSRGLRKLSLIAGWLLACSQLSWGDCNGNGIDDAVDIAQGFSNDCNGNAIPDECDLAPVAFAPSRETLSVSRIPRVIQAGDLDGDSDLDLVTGNQNTNRTATISILLNQGNRAFAPAAHLEAGARLSSLALQDLEGDGHLDLVSAGDGGLAVFQGRGDGTFSPPAEHPMQESPSVVAAVASKGGPFKDLVTVNPSSDSLSLLHNAGDGTYGPLTTVAVGKHPSGVAAGDFDLDGDLDLAVSNRDSATVSVLLRGADGNLAEAADYDTGAPKPLDIVALDFDRDDDLDLATFTRTNVSLLANNGAGQFDELVLFEFSGWANSLSAEDIDGDGDADLIVGFARQDQVILLRSEGTAELRGWVQRHANLPRSTSLAVADLDSDGFKDLAFVVSNSVTVRWNVGNVDHSPWTQGTYLVGANPHTIGLGDLDGDQDLDVATGNHVSGTGVSVLKNRGDGRFSEAERFPTGGFSFSIALADLDGDGDLDFASTHPEGNQIQILANDGHGAYSPLENYPVGRWPYHVVVDDLNADGLIDVISANQSSNTTSLLFNQGDGTFGSRSDVSVGSTPLAVATADLDGDGDVDIAVANSVSLDVSLLENGDGGTFRETARHTLLGSPVFVTASDLDRDGRPDLSLANTTGRGVSILWNKGQSVADLFETQQDFVIEASPHSLIDTDLDGDGNLDIVTGNAESDSLSVLSNRAGRLFSAPLTLSVGNQPRWVVAGDLDSDGDPDLVSANRLSEDLTVLLNGNRVAVEESLEAICTESDFFDVSVNASAEGPVLRLTKYTAPARESAELLSTQYQNAHRFETQEEFLGRVFPELFPTLPADQEAYRRLVARRATRDYYAGVLSQRSAPEGVLFAFTIVTDADRDERETLRLEEVQSVYETIRRSFRLQPLAYEPDTVAARREARSWNDPPFPVLRDGPSPAVPFRRGDVDADGTVNTTDAISLLHFIFLRGASPPCLKSADVNDDGRINVEDGIDLLLSLFGGQVVLRLPASCMPDPTADSLACLDDPTCGTE